METITTVVEPTTVTSTTQNVLNAVKETALNSNTLIGAGVGVAIAGGVGAYLYLKKNKENKNLRKEVSDLGFTIKVLEDTLHKTKANAYKESPKEDFKNV